MDKLSYRDLTTKPRTEPFEREATPAKASNMGPASTMAPMPSPFSNGMRPTNSADMAGVTHVTPKTGGK